MSEVRKTAGSIMVVKLVLVSVGMATFGAGIRVDNVWVRWAGIGLVAVAWVLRFVKRPRPADEGTAP